MVHGARDRHCVFSLPVDNDVRVFVLSMHESLHQV
jgi:hypothetical protein